MLRLVVATLGPEETAACYERLPRLRWVPDVSRE
jgi:hypothetical protein